MNFLFAILTLLLSPLALCILSLHTLAHAAWKRRKRSRDRRAM